MAESLKGLNEATLVRTNHTRSEGCLFLESRVRVFVRLLLLMLLSLFHVTLLVVLEAEVEERAEADEKQEAEE